MSTSDSHQTSAAVDRCYRNLWIAVVLQAKDDIENEPLDSINFAQAVAFFIGSGNWVQNRTVIGDYLDMHRDDLERLGRRCINERRVSAGLEPLRPRQPWPTPTRAPKAVEQTPEPSPPSPCSPRLQPVSAQVSPFVPRGIYASMMSGDRAA